MHGMAAVSFLVERIMTPSFSRFGKAVLFLVVATALAMPGCAPPPPAITTLEGTDPNTAPPPSPQQTLTDLINQYRTTNGMAALTYDSVVADVAQVHTEYMASIGELTPIMNGEDLTTRLVLRHLGPGPTGTAGAYLARGYSDPQTLFAAMSGQNAIMLGNYTRLGIGMANPGTGNYWTVLFY